MVLGDSVSFEFRIFIQWTEEKKLVDDNKNRVNFHSKQ